MYGKVKVNIKCVDLYGASSVYPADALNVLVPCEQKCLLHVSEGSLSGVRVVDKVREAVPG